MMNGRNLYPLWISINRLARKCPSINRNCYCGKLYDARTISTGSSLMHLMDARDKDHAKKEKNMVIKHGHEYFDEDTLKEKNKATYIAALNRYLAKQGTYRRGHVEFIYASMNHLRDYGVQRDIEVYKKLFSLFPPKVMVARTTWQVEMMHYPKQQQCAIDMLEHMEENGLIPDDELGYQLIELFGDRSYVFRRYRRMMYWLPKFKYSNPYYVPHDLPNDDIELAKMALRRMCIDMETQISVYDTKDLDAAADETVIVSGQSATQQTLLSEHSSSESLFVEGPYREWLRSKSLVYFILRSEQTSRSKIFTENRRKEDTDDTKFHWNFWLDEEPSDVVAKPTVHEQEDGTVLAICITGTSSKDSLVSWIKFLEKTNPKLASTPVVFRLKSTSSEIIVPVQSSDFVERIPFGFD